MKTNMRNEIVPTRLAEGNGHDLSLWETVFLFLDESRGPWKTVNIWATGTGI